MRNENPKLAQYPKKVAIQGDAQVTIRPMEEDDFDRVRTFFNNLPREDRLFLRHDVTRPEVFARWFAELDYTKKLPLMALHGDAVVGHALLDAEQKGWSPHVAEIRVVVADAFKKRAVGKVLAREIFDQAIARGYEKVIAQMMNNQAAARRMFERMGFIVEAELRDHVRDLDGKKHNLLIMSCALDDAWAKMEELLQDFSPWAGWG
ncbi:MAG: GNAT family N-acetyltransferase [Polyangiaceae bacterium]|jgi:L-amino acid N-acyltransferase YncA|nr:GNAT family N-acetyltransferase [Polyangiaceae bacterium]